MRSSRIGDATSTSLAVVILLFAITLVQISFGLRLAGLGIVPRTAPGLIGILSSPLLHANLAHVTANALPLFVLLTLLRADLRYRPDRTLSLIWIGSGLGTWLIGRGNAVHIGASSVVFGLAAFLIVAGLVLRSWRSVIVALIVLLFFGGLFYGVLPQAGPISWEGHLSGAVVGAWTATRIRRGR